MITYRQAKFDDVENIHKLLNDYAKEGLMLPRSRNAIYENLRDYIVAVQGSHLVGCGALHFVWDRLAEIRSLAVDPELKCTGIGRKIVELLEKEGVERGVKMFFTLTYQPGFFAKCNYIILCHNKSFIHRNVIPAILSIIVIQFTRHRTMNPCFKFY